MNVVTHSFQDPEDVGPSIIHLRHAHAQGVSCSLNIKMWALCRIVTAVHKTASLAALFVFHYRGIHPWDRASNCKLSTDRTVNSTAGDSQTVL